MDFFQKQAEAKRRSGLLLLLFGFAVLGIAAAVWGLLALSVGRPALRPEVIVGTLAAVSLLVGVGSIYRTLTLNAGGAAIASQLGGRLLDPATAKHPLERRLLNVVEEMALASGVPVPPVFLLDGEQGINAFAAGKSIGDAVIGVTRGTIETLSRDELQGVIAHEFSHILNGDMRINIRLIGLLHGILLIALAGRLMIHLAQRSSHAPPSRDNGQHGTAAFALFGTGLLLIGSIGVFFGNLIKAAVSRQREFLADASAVQFTRHPGGIAGALKKIGALAEGSLLKAQGASEVSHFLFADGLRRLLGGLLATHPPLIQRIRAIEPTFDGDFSKWLSSQPRPDIREDAPSPKRPQSGGGAPLQIPGLPTLPGFPASEAAAAGFVEQDSAAKASRDEKNLSELPAETGSEKFSDASSDTSRLNSVAAAVVGSVGELMHFAGQEIHDDFASMPPVIQEAREEIYCAATLLVALLLSRAPMVHRAQMEQVEQVMGKAFAADAARLADDVRSLQPGRRLALLDLLAPPLRSLSLAQYSALARLVRALMEIDSDISLFEFAVHRALMRHLDQHFGLDKPPRANRGSISKLSAQIQVLLGFLSKSNSSSDGGANAYARAIALLPEVPAEHRSMPQARLLTLEHLDSALDDLAELAPAKRRRLIEACAVAVLADEHLNAYEIALIRAISNSLDCPIPPLIVTRVAA